MRSKKLLSAALATALVATTMSMPVLAADGGGFDVTVTTKTPVLRVVVPTSMEVAVNQFELKDAGSQIYSSAFAMDNQGESPVKVEVTSTAELKASTKLVSTKQAATASTTAGEAWLAVAAQTSDGKYIEDASKGLNDLTEASPNVDTFKTADGASTVKQTFYLDMPSAVTYKLLNANESTDGISYAQFYELTPKAFTSGSEDAEIQELIAKQDLYYATAAATDGQTLTKVEGSNFSHTSGNVYYTVASEPTKTTIADSHTELYVYADGASATTGGKAAFRYIGKLSPKQDSWAKEDLPKVTVAYNIVAVSTTDYNALKNANPAVLTYGLYREANKAPSIATTTYTMVANTAIPITVDLGNGNKAANGVASVMYNGTNIASSNVGFATYANGTITLTAQAVNNLMAKTGNQTIKVVFDDTDATEVEITLQK